MRAPGQDDTYGSTSKGMPACHAPEGSRTGLRCEQMGMGSASVTQPPGNASFIEVVGRHLHLHAIPHRQPHPTLAHLATDGGEHDMLVGQFNAEHGAREHSFHTAFNLDMLFFH